MAHDFTFDFITGNVTANTSGPVQYSTGSNTSGPVQYNTGVGTGAVYPQPQQAGVLNPGIVSWQHLTGVDASGLTLPDHMLVCDKFRDLGNGHCKCGHPYDGHPEATLELLLYMKEKLK